MPSSLFLEALEQRNLFSGNPVFSVSDFYMTEGDNGSAKAAVVVTVSGSRLKQSATINFATQNGTALAGTDYVATSGKVTFAPGDTSKTIFIDVKGDHLAESDEYFLVNIQGTKNAKIARRQGFVNISDNEPGVTFADISTNEGNSGTSLVNVTVGLSRIYDQDVTVNYATADGDALAGAYVAATGSITIPAGETSQTIQVGVIGNRAAGPDSYFAINLNAGPNAHILRSSGYVTILDDEPRASIFSSSFLEGDLGTTQVNIVLNLSGAYDEPVTVNYVTEGGTASAGTDFLSASSSVTFAPNETSKAFQISIIGDRFAEPDEIIGFTLQCGSNAAVAEEQGTVAILDNEPRLSVDWVTDYEGESGAKAFVFTVSLQFAYDQAVTVDFATGNFSAIDGIDYQSNSGSLTFAPGDTAKTVTVLVYGNLIPEDTKQFSMTLSNASLNASIVNPLSYGSILDDDGYYYDPGYGGGYDGGGYYYY